ncbi:MAG TPA: MaoC family dehydratase [Dehalococcoidia bacterium]|nr:MaoC family dehydratase [Dehalococcoidia bacterium]
MSQIYFEDFELEDELPTEERHPTEDLAMDFFGHDNLRNSAFSDAEAGKRMGVGGALVPGLLKLSWFTQYLSDWAGLEGSVKSLRLAFRRPDIQQKPLILTGKIVDKRQEDGKNVVELELAMINDSGEPSVRATAAVELPSKA